MHRPEELRSKNCLSAIEFLLGMQCPKGGWACFDAWDNRNRWLNKTPFGQGNEFFDPAVPDITGRVLECFGLLLETNDEFAEKTGELLISGKLSLRLRHSCFRAIQYLASEQNSEGLWQSRWHVNYLNGTYSVLCGLKFFLKNMSNSLGSDIMEKLVGRPLAWITSMQNEDGGWGGRVTTYRSPLEAGCGTSTATQTAWVSSRLQNVWVAFSKKRKPFPFRSRNMPSANLSSSVRNKYANLGPAGSAGHHGTSCTPPPDRHCYCERRTISRHNANHRALRI